jgi:hypothetical protein
MPSVIPCCIANANGAACSCHIPDASILYEENKRLRAALRGISLATTYTPTTPSTGSDAENLKMSQDIINKVAQIANDALAGLPNAQDKPAGIPKTSSPS